MENKSFTVSQEHHKVRLDKFLAEKLPETTRSQIKKMIEQGFILVNTETPSVHHFLKTGDAVELTEPKAKVWTDMPKPKVVKETDEYLVINKPAGLLVHPAKSSQAEPTLIDWLVKHCKDIGAVGSAERPGLVHRLDRDTSGLMVIAKTPESFENLKKQFHDHSVEKHYTVLVHGHPIQDRGEIDFPIGRSRNKGRMAVRPKDAFESDRQALTKFEVIKKFNKEFTLIDARPMTGRTHQIRAHFMAWGNPVVGDTLYTVTKQKLKIDLGRHFLHASKLSFIDLSGKKRTYNSKLPKELQTFLDTLT